MLGELTPKTHWSKRKEVNYCIISFLAREGDPPLLSVYTKVKKKLLCAYLNWWVWLKVPGPQIYDMPGERTPKNATFELMS